MAILQRNVSYAKEIDDFMLLLVSVVKDAKAGLPITNELGQLLVVLSGLGQLGDEVKDLKTVEETVGYRIGDLINALIG